MTDTMTPDTNVYEKTIEKLEKRIEALEKNKKMWQDWYTEASARARMLEQFIVGEVEAGNMPQVQARLQSKIERQKAVLNTLNRRVRGQRLHLRRINELGRGLTIEEWNEAKALYPADLEETPPQF